MTSISSKSDEQALALALSLAASAECRISRLTLQKHFSKAGQVLIADGLLRPEGHSASVADIDDVPVSVEWLPERGSFGYFSESDGWVDIATDLLSDFTLQIEPLAKRLTAALDVLPKERFVELSPGVVWEYGTCRLPGRAARIPLWIARRLHDPAAWKTFLELTRTRPTQNLRMVLHLAETEGQQLPFVANHVIVAVGAVISASGAFQVDPDIVAARLKSPMHANGPVKPSADGGYVEVHGKTYVFRGGKQRTIVRLLCEAWLRGEPRCLTEEVMDDAGSSGSTRRLARAFKGHSNWHEIIKEADGHCWLEA